MKGADRPAADAGIGRTEAECAASGSMASGGGEKENPEDGGASRSGTRADAAISGAAAGRFSRGAVDGFGPVLVPDERIEWVFAYGSLMWDPGFVPAEAVRAWLAGYRRDFALWSHHYRGTPDLPGLVLALEPAEGAACPGMALRLPEEGRAAIIAGLRRRELVSYAYAERLVTLELADGRRVEALAYVVRAGHPQHATGLSPDEKARIIARARGARGANGDYLANTLAHLGRLGIADPALAALSAAVRRFGHEEE